MGRTKKVKVLRLKVDNINNEPAFFLKDIEKIKLEREHLAKDIYKDLEILELIELIENTFELFKEKYCKDRGINKAIEIEETSKIVGVPYSCELLEEDDDSLKSKAGHLIEKHVINDILIPNLGGIIHPNGAYLFPDWLYLNRYIDIKAALVVRSKMKYQSKFNNPVYNNALEDSSKVLENLRAYFRYKNSTAKLEKFCESFLIYCYYEVFKGTIRILDFVVVPTIQAIQVSKDENGLFLAEKNRGKNTNTRINLTYEKCIYKTDKLFELVNS